MGSYTAIIKRDGDWWIGWVEEVPGVNAFLRLSEKFHRFGRGENANRPIIRNWFCGKLVFCSFFLADIEIGH